MPIYTVPTVDYTPPIGVRNRYTSIMPSWKFSSTRRKNENNNEIIEKAPLIDISSWQIRFQCFCNLICWGSTVRLPNLPLIWFNMTWLDRKFNHGVFPINENFFFNCNCVNKTFQLSNYSKGYKEPLRLPFPYISELAWASFPFRLDILSQVSLILIFLG